MDPSSGSGAAPSPPAPNPQKPHSCCSGVPPCGQPRGDLSAHPIRDFPPPAWRPLHCAPNTLQRCSHRRPPSPAPQTTIAPPGAGLIQAPTPPPSPQIHRLLQSLSLVSPPLQTSPAASGPALPPQRPTGSIRPGAARLLHPQAGCSGRAPGLPRRVSSEPPAAASPSGKGERQEVQAARNRTPRPGPPGQI